MNTKQKAALVAQAHHLKPVVMLGQKGLTANVIAETDQALTVHELIKIKIAADDKDERTAILEEICSQLNAEPLKLIGNIAIIYREKQK
jgi:RNA-binding protein